MNVGKYKKNEYIEDPPQLKTSDFEVKKYLNPSVLDEFPKVRRRRTKTRATKQICDYYFSAYIRFVEDE